jgi:phosphoribosyl-ATP pyrophosphohydrolase/phosphoribosyl-AMP cyclohydrolase
MRLDDTKQIDALDFGKGGGLVPVVAQHARTGEVLMLGYASREALHRTLESGEMWYFSRSRDRLWHKGEVSGNTQRMVSLHTDCDRDTVLALVEPLGPTCHTGSWSCLDAPPVLAALGALLERRASERPDGSYTARLLGDENLRLKKLGEEAVELALACAAGDASRASEEAADVIYHALVACLGAGSSVDAVLAALERRLPGQQA